MKRVFAWFQVPANRRKVYVVARVVLPLLVAAGWVTSGQQNTALAVLDFVASFAVPHLAAKNTPKPTKSQAGGVDTLLALQLATFVGVVLLLFRIHF